MTTPTSQSLAPATARILFGIPIDPLTMQQALDRVGEAVASRKPLRIGVVNAAKVVNMRTDDVLRSDVVSSDLVLADGMAVVWASWLLGAPLPERVAGIDLMEGILERGRRRGLRVYCLGATREVVAEVARLLPLRFPGIVVAGWRDGYFPAADEVEVAAAIAASHADVLFVAITSPKKEMFLARWGSHVGVPVCHGVGGSFDVFAGRVRRAPHAWRRMGLEWLYRVLQEPRRLWRRYLVTNAVFCSLIAVELARRCAATFGRRSAHSRTAAP